jgi:hypothetical protein
MSIILLWLGLQVALNSGVPKPELPPVQQKGLASGYSPWAEEHIWLRRGKKLRVSNGKPYCWWKRIVKKGDPIIAHRTLPCGTKVFVSVVGKPQQGAWLVVGDRGPYGACVKQSKLPAGAIWTISKYCQRQYGSDTVWYVKRRASYPGTWRAVADISHAARKMIGHNGFEPIVIRYWKRKKAPKPPLDNLFASK